MRQTLLLSSMLTIGMLLFAAFHETISPPHRRYQVQYRNALIEQAQTPEETGDAKAYRVRRRQLFLPHLGEADRCVSCHVGVEDPRMKEQAQPIKTHPGDILAKHDIRKMGCTICHDGQGRATRKADAHANDIKFWEKPRLHGDMMQANCLRCHHIESLPMTTTLQRGRKLFAEGGCLGCHKRNGVGGFLGPDLSAIGDASFHVKAPVAKYRESLLGKFEGNVNLAYLYEAVRYPKAQPHDSSMIIQDLTDEDAYALAIYLKSFSNARSRTVFRTLKSIFRRQPAPCFMMRVVLLVTERMVKVRRFPNSTKLGPPLPVRRSSPSRNCHSSSPWLLPRAVMSCRNGVVREECRNQKSTQSAVMC
ncbi:MAG: c-type cytochrome [Kiritimatiellia bacterium]|nr:c-type cytochrome [Kiritimatiellia bacterium]